MFEFPHSLRQSVESATILLTLLRDGGATVRVITECGKQLRQSNPRHFSNSMAGTLGCPMAIVDDTMQHTHTHTHTRTHILLHACSAKRVRNNLNQMPHHVVTLNGTVWNVSKYILKIILDQRRSILQVF